MKNKRRNETNPWLGLAPYKEGMSFWGRSKECILLSEIIKNNNEIKENKDKNIVKIKIWIEDGNVLS